MIRLGLRLSVAGGKEAVTRLALIALAVAIGVGLLLTTLGSINAFNAQNARYAWLETGYPGAEAAAPTGSAAVDPLWWLLRADYFHGKSIGRVDLAPTGPNSPVPPGIPSLPGPGEFYASPALAKLLRDTPAAQLGDRYPGTLIGTIGPEALPAPDTLIIIIGHDAADLSQKSGAHPITRISTTPPSHCGGECAPAVGTNSNGVTLVLSIVAAALLFPVLVFIGGATRLSAARREQRFAAMRLVGATPQQISRLATVESSVATVVGVVAGFGLFYALRPAIARVAFTGERFFTSDLSLSLIDALVVAIGIPIAAAVAAWLALRRVNISPLGVSRRVTPPQPRSGRVIPMLAGIVWLVYLAYVSDIAASHNSTKQAISYLAGVFLIMIGLVIAGPWLTMMGSRVMARRAGRPAGLIAARRLSDDPKGSFRAISGLVLAVFVATCAIGIITTIVAYNGGATGDSANSTGTVIQLRDRVLRSDIPAAPISEKAVNAFSSIPGVDGVAAIHLDLAAGSAPVPDRRPQFFVACAQIVHTPALGHCPGGADVVSIRPDFGGGVTDTSTAMSNITWPAANLTTEKLSSLPIDAVAVSTDGSTSAVEQVRTALEKSLPTSFPPQTISEFNADNTRLIDSYRQLANVVLLTTLPIAGCSLAVSVAGGISQRRRPFSLLRLTGVPLAMLRRVVTLEAAVPLLLSVLVSVGAGLAAAALFLRAQLGQTLQPPNLSYYVLVVGGVLASLAIIASTLPLLARVTGPDTARNE